jgi:stage II sporulation protein D
MKKWTVIIFILGMLFPAIFTAIAPKQYGETESDHKDSAKSSMKICVLQNDKPIIMDMEEYLVGVILKEIPRGFYMEAIKAQAVVSRTYALKMLQQSSKHTASICTEPDCCQGYISPHEYILKGGNSAFLSQVRQAVTETKDLIITYNGELIEATFFSCSGGRTEDAVAVWGTDIPYLQSTHSPGEDAAAHFTDAVTFSAEDFCQKLGINNSPIVIEDIKYTEGGGVDTIRIGGKIFSGVKIRKLLQLRSTNFTIEQRGDSIIVSTKGFGHRVGMSQYGADAMAAAGADFKQIIFHYYTGVQVQELNG